MTCIIPIWLTIIAAQPCVTYERVLQEWAKVETVRDLERWTRGLPSERKTLEESLPLLGLTIHEELTAFPCGEYTCAGELTISFGLLASLRFALDTEPRYGTLFHELAHWSYYKWQSREEGRTVGHAGTDDPHFWFLDQWRCWLYPCTEERIASPRLLPFERSAQVITTEHEFHERLLN